MFFLHLPSSFHSLPLSTLSSVPELFSIFHSCPLWSDFAQTLGSGWSALPWERAPAPGRQHQNTLLSQFPSCCHGSTFLSWVGLLSRTSLIPWYIVGFNIGSLIRLIISQQSAVIRKFLAHYTLRALACVAEGWYMEAISRPGLALYT